VSGNTVYNAHAAYGGGFAAGIYVDGGQNIVLTDNVSHDNDEGLEVGAELHNAKATGITVSDNLLYHNTQAGLVFGAFASTAGVVTNCYFVNNTVYNNDWNDPTHSNEGQLCITEASNCVVANNIFDAVGTEVLVHWQPWNLKAEVNDKLDYNLYYTPGGSTDTSAFTYGKNHYSFQQWTKAPVSQDAHSLFGDPQFVNAVAADFTLAANSPALGAGSSTANWYDPKNFNGQTRSLPPNIGAY
jgi:hypothetical protein